jgi:hypothetical protein
MGPITAHGSVVLSLRVAPVTPAAAFLGAAEALLSGVQPLASSLPRTAWPLTFLAGQVVECLLKAYLAKRGVREEELKQRSVRHNLLKLWSQAVSHGLSFAPRDPIWLQRLSELHNGPYVIRYPMGLNGVVLPQCAEMARDLPILVRAVRDGASGDSGGVAT